MSFAKYFTWICLTQGRSKNRWIPKLNCMSFWGNPSHDAMKSFIPNDLLKAFRKTSIERMMFIFRAPVLLNGWLPESDMSFFQRGPHMVGFSRFQGFTLHSDCVMNCWTTTRPPYRQTNSEHKKRHPETYPGFSLCHEHPRWSTAACRCVTGCKLRFMMPAVIKRHASKVIKFGFTVLDIPTASPQAADQKELQGF